MVKMLLIAACGLTFGEVAIAKLPPLTVEQQAAAMSLV